MSVPLLAFLALAAAAAAASGGSSRPAKHSRKPDDPDEPDEPAGGDPLPNEPFTVEVGQGVTGHSHLWSDTGTLLHTTARDFTPGWLSANEWDGVLGWTSEIDWPGHPVPDDAKPNTGRSMHQILLTPPQVTKLRDTGEVVFETKEARVTWIGDNQGQYGTHDHTHPVRIRAQRTQ